MGTRLGLSLRFGVHCVLLQQVRVKVRAQGALITESGPERHSMISKKSLGKVYSRFANTISENESGVQIIDFENHKTLCSIFCVVLNCYSRGSVGAAGAAPEKYYTDTLLYCYS